jgi:hypothetical protein
LKRRGKFIAGIIYQIQNIVPKICHKHEFLLLAGGVPRLAGGRWWFLIPFQHFIDADSPPIGGAVRSNPAEK